MLEIMLTQWLHNLLGHWPWWHYYNTVGGRKQERVCRHCGRRQRWQWLLEYRTLNQIGGWWRDV
jgi:hypothetical protein